MIPVKQDKTCKTGQRHLRFTYFLNESFCDEECDTKGRDDVGYLQSRYSFSPPRSVGHGIDRCLGYDPIWFGVISVIMMEMGLITPPVGMNIFIMAGMARDIPITTMFRGISSFLFALVVCVVLLLAVPQIALFLPDVLR